MSEGPAAPLAWAIEIYVTTLVRGSPKNIIFIAVKTHLFGMKIIAFFFIFFLWSTLGFSQAGKLSLGIHSSVDSYRFDLLPPDEFSKEIKSKLNYSVGATLQYDCNKLTFSSGVWYSTIGYITRYNWQFTTPNDPSIPKELNLTANYLTYPLCIHYKFFNHERVSFYILGGFTFSFLVHRKSTFTMENGDKKDIYGFQVGSFKPVFMMARLAPGVNFKLAPGCFIGFEPFFSYGLNSFSGITSKPIVFGGAFKLQFLLKP